ncbi:MAG: ATP-binding cassette, subfamily er 3, partial [Solirubrobacterales bacterium]|nr:ATP-binding cassette, subfamily er 3 [Solirubrobacterales bacterium]
MSAVVVSEIGKDIGGRTLWSSVSFKLHHRERMTLAGRNGAGKTTLLRALSGEVSLDRGTISLGRGTRVALHDQRPPRGSGETLREYVLSGLSEPLAIERRLAELEARMAAGDAEAATLEEYARVQARLEHVGGYRWRDPVEATLRGLGFDDDALGRGLESFSGGELTRASLARALASRPDLLLLDEPTNHLDIASLEWLEGYLTELDAAIVLVAHDRWFLESVGTCVLELSDERAMFFKGPWHAWREERARRELELGRAAERRRSEIERMERFVERFRYKATKARQAQSRLKAIERLQAAGPEATAVPTRSLAFAFESPHRSGATVLELNEATIEAGGRTLLEVEQLWLERGERLSIVGANGSGKTTLIETLAGRRPLANGSLRVGHNVEIGYLSQHADEIGNGDRSVLAAACAATGLSEARARSLLGRFLFSGSEAQLSVANLSGGERRRLSLAIVVAAGANALILDEPTNHLDVESREALEAALAGFGGAIILVSHDRALLEALGGRTVVIEDGALRSYPGGWAEYVEARKAATTSARKRKEPAGARPRVVRTPDSDP